MLAARSTMRAILPPMPKAGVISASGSPSIIICPASRARRLPSIAHVAAGSSTIRVGAGGIMLPNHAPLIVAEQFGTLARLYPGRIDLGLGRAPGTDQLTVRALRRTLGADTFPQDVRELQFYFSPEAAHRQVQAVPAAGTEVPLWILGSSTYGAQLAAESVCAMPLPLTSRPTSCSRHCRSIAAGSSHRSNLPAHMP
jgi:luciferase family oxidoreductase group 1